MSEFKIQKESYIHRTIRFPEYVWEHLQHVAQNNDVSANALILQCVTYALEHLEKAKDV